MLGHNNLKDFKIPQNNLRSNIVDGFFLGGGGSIYEIKKILDWMVNNNSIISMWELERVFSHPQITYDENERPKVNINPPFFAKLVWNLLFRSFVLLLVRQR